MIENFLPGGPEPTIGEELFGEAALNLTAIFEGAGLNPCFSFGQISLHGRSSESDSASMQDLVGPVPLLVRNCTAAGIKYHDLNANGNQDAGEPGLTGFRIWADYDNDGVIDADEPFDDTNAAGEYLIEDINPPDGDYSLREKLTSGAGTDGWICSEPTTTIANGPFPCAYVDIDAGEESNVTGKDFGNYKKPTIIVEKQTVPDGAATSFAFTSTIPGKASFNLTDGQQNSTEVTPGVYTATETPVPAGWTLTDITCSGDTVAPNSSDAGATATFNAQSGETIKCVFTNTRDTGKLTVIKQLVPESDPGLFDLRIETEVVVDDASDGDSGFRVLPTGDYDVSELAGTGTSLAKYDSKVECSNGQSAVPGTSLADVHVTKDSDITCTFTNTRRTGKLTVVKDLIPSNDPGLFDLRINSEVVADDVGDGGSGSRDLAPGDYTVSELAGTGTSLGDYASSIECDNGDEGLGTSLAGVTVDSNDDITCTITNSRDVGKLEVVKNLVSDDPKESGLFNLQIDSTTLAANVGDGGTTGEVTVNTGDHSVGETAGTGTSLSHYDSSIECRDEDGEGDVVAEGDGAGPLTVEVTDNSDIVCVITNEAILNPDIEVDKKIRNVTLGGTFVDTPPPIDAYVGDTLEYQFAVTNPGNVALAVDLDDPRCDAGTMTAPVKTGGDQDALLDPGETWTYTCTHVVTEADPDPLPNTVTATGTVPNTERPPVTDEDSAEADIFHPKIDIEKAGPATATAGSVLSYTLTVTNPGDIEFAATLVVVTDPGCDDQPTLTSKNGDPSPDFLNPGDTWTYTCSHLTATTDTSFTNVANVKGRDRNNREATDTDDLPTALGQVLPQPEIVSGTARLRGPSGCVRGPFRATVRGSRISRVTFFVDGKRFKRITAPNGEGSRFTVSINPRGRGFGVHRVTARVEFAAASQTQTRTLRLSFQRCKKQVVKPRFTG